MGAGAARVGGCVVYPDAEPLAPGVVRYVVGDRFPLGGLDGADTPRACALSDAFGAVGLKAPVLDDIRSGIWFQPWGNLTFNPIAPVKPLGRTLKKDRAYIRAHPGTV